MGDVGPICGQLPSRRSKTNGQHAQEFYPHVHGFFSAHHPLLGTIKHAPSANNAAAKYFEQDLISLSDYQRRKELRNSPFTGQFHQGPRVYTKLHDLRRFDQKHNKKLRQHSLSPSHLGVGGFLNTFEGDGLVDGVSPADSILRSSSSVLPRNGLSETPSSTPSPSLIMRALSADTQLEHMGEDIKYSNSTLSSVAIGSDDSTGASKTDEEELSCSDTMRAMSKHNSSNSGTGWTTHNDNNGTRERHTSSERDLPRSRTRSPSIETTNPRTRTLSTGSASSAASSHIWEKRIHDISANNSNSNSRRTRSIRIGSAPPAPQITAVDSGSRQSLTLSPVAMPSFLTDRITDTFENEDQQQQQQHQGTITPPPPPLHTLDHSAASLPGNESLTHYTTRHASQLLVREDSFSSRSLRSGQTPTARKNSLVGAGSNISAPNYVRSPDSEDARSSYSPISSDGIVPRSFSCDDNNDSVIQDARNLSFVGASPHSPTQSQAKYAEMAVTPIRMSGGGTVASSFNSLALPPPRQKGRHARSESEAAIDLSGLPFGIRKTTSMHSPVHAGKAKRLGKLEQLRQRAKAKQKEQENLPSSTTRDQNPWAVNTATEVFDKYDLMDKAKRNASLGQGTYSEVLTVVHRKTGLMYALKMVKKRYLLSEEERDMVRREVEIHQVLRHPNIIRLCEIFDDDLKLYLVLERANYGTLEHLMLNRPNMTETDAALIMTQLMRAMAYLHANGVLQADIKPNNILLNCPSVPSHGDAVAAAASSFGEFQIPVSCLELKVCDFGLSRKVPDVKYYKYTGDVHKVPYTSIRGTVGYISPEILTESSYGIAADMWSAGIIMYELIAGMKPFVPYSDCLVSPPDFPSVVWKSKSVLGVNMIKRLLVLNPNDRMTAHESLQESWIHIFASC